jgi:hypothetical protein
MKCETVMTVNTEGSVFWDMMPCSDGRFEESCYIAVQILDMIYPADGDRRFVRNIGSYLPEDIASQPPQNPALSNVFVLILYLFINYMFY